MDPHNIRMARMHGCGNQFIVVEDIDNVFQEHYDQLYHTISEHYVFDQLLIISKNSSFYFTIINHDGSHGKQCLNGARCVAHYLVSQQLVPSSVFTLSNASGAIPVVFNDASSVMLTLKIPTRRGSCEGGMCVDVGNPHLIFFVDTLAEIDVDRIGRDFQKKFAEGINVGFVNCVDRNTIRLRTYERGCGETEACGSSALASVFAGIELGKLNDTVRVSFYSEKYSLTINKHNEQMELIGPSCLLETFTIPIRDIVG